MPRFTRLTAENRRAQIIEAAARCMAEGGIAAFTVDRICLRAQVSRGLITHHFGSMAGLMAATYAHLYDEDVPTQAQPDLGQLFDGIFAEDKFNRARLSVWLALWQAIATSPELTEEHRARYAGYRSGVEAALQSAGRAPALAPSLIAFIDGLALQHCIDPESLPAPAARAAAEAFLSRVTPA